MLEMALSVDDIAQRLGGELIGPPDVRVVGVNQLDRAEAGQLTFVRDENHAAEWADSRASAALIGPTVRLDADKGRALIRVKDTDLALAEIVGIFAPKPTEMEAGAHETAVIESTANIDPSARIGPHCVIGREVSIGAETVIHANVTIFEKSTIGQDCVIYPSTVIRERSRIGDRCILHANVTIGSDGFGYKPAPDGKSLTKIPQIGSVRIGDDVEIGSSTCIDRGSLDATVIGSGCKIDNLCQIAHNCELGRCVIMAGMCGLAGSVKIGHGAILGGSVKVKDHISIGAGATIAGSSGVMNDIPAGETWAGYRAAESRIALREYVAMRKLLKIFPEIIKSLKK